VAEATRGGITRDEPLGYPFAYVGAKFIFALVYSGWRQAPPLREATLFKSNSFVYLENSTIAVDLMGVVLYFKI